MPDSDLLKLAADRSGDCPENERPHVPGDFSIDRHGGRATCHWCGEGVNLDG